MFRNLKKKKKKKISIGKKSQKINFFLAAPILLLPLYLKSTNNFEIVLHTWVNLEE